MVGCYTQPAFLTQDSLQAHLAPFVRPADGVGGSAIVLIDLDNLSVDQLFTWFAKQLAGELKITAPPLEVELMRSPNARAGLFAIKSAERVGHVVLVPVGVPDDGLLKAFLIERFAIDDHILRLVREQAVYEAVSELEHISYELA